MGFLPTAGGAAHPSGDDFRVTMSAEEPAGPAPRLLQQQQTLSPVNRPISAHSGCLFVGAKFLDLLAPNPRQSCAHTNQPC